MIEVFKTIHGMDKVNLGKLFCVDEDEGTRKHSFCLKIRRHVNSNILLHFFNRRAINYWNQLYLLNINQMPNYLYKNNTSNRNESCITKLQ